MNSMTTPKVKLAVSLDADVAAQLRAAAADGRARSVSAYVQHAVQAQFAAEADFDLIVEEMLATTGGAVTDQERAEAARLLGVGTAS